MTSLKCTVYVQLFEVRNFHGLTNFRIFMVLFSRFTRSSLRLPIREHRAIPDNH